MRTHQAIAWEKKLKRVFDSIDDHLENKYGARYRLHPTRPRRGTTSNKEHDGLFRVGAAFSAGFGSKHGRGYVVEIRMARQAALSFDTGIWIEGIERALEKIEGIDGSASWFERTEGSAGYIRLLGEVPQALRVPGL